MTSLYIDHFALAPAYAVVGTALAILLVDLFVPRASLLLVGIATTGLITAAILAAQLARGSTRRGVCTETCHYVTSPGVAGLVVVVCALTLAVVWLSYGWLRSAEQNGLSLGGEYFFLLLTSLVGIVVLAGARDWLTLLIALETLTLPGYALVGIRRASGAFTLFILSVTATSVLLLGVGILYAVGIPLDFDHSSSEVSTGSYPTAIGATAVTLAVVGVVFKLGAAPWHVWPQAAYSGAPAPFAAYLATVSKLGGLAAISLVVFTALPTYVDTLAHLVGVIAFITMTLGNLSALRQTRMLRVLGFSSVAQAGFMLVPFGVALGNTRFPLTAAWVYALLISVITLVVFGALTFANTGDDDLESFRGFARRHPWVGVALLGGLVGLSGLPPVIAGLWAKLDVLSAVLRPAPSWWPIVLALAIAANIAIGVAVYLRVARVLVAPATSTAAATPLTPGFVSAFRIAALGAAVAVTIVVSFWPQPVYELAAAIAGSFVYVSP